MRITHRTSRFKKDLRLVRKRQKNIDKLKHVMTLLAEERDLPEKYKDHPLKGAFFNYRECHIEPDWLLIYQLQETVVYFVRTGTHSDIFG